MLEKILKLYTMAIAGDVRSPMPHLIGPPGCGKSTVAKQAADILGVNLHTINVSRMSPLEIEGVQMPEAHGDEGQLKLRLLHSTLWTQLQEGDIILFDEFLRGFPEVYNALLDIFTSREVVGLKIPNVFIMGASNSAVAYDGALEDRLLHLPVTDPRTHKGERQRLAQLIIDELGLLPSMVKSPEIEEVLNVEVLPMFNVLDSFKGKGTQLGSTMATGQSLRKLIGMAKLREVQSHTLESLISMNNARAMTENKAQFVLLLHGKQVPHSYETAARRLVGNDKLTELQALNLNLNLQLIELEELRSQDKKGTDQDDPSDIFIS